MGDLFQWASIGLMAVGGLGLGAAIGGGLAGVFRLQGGRMAAAVGVAAVLGVGISLALGWNWGGAAFPSPGGGLPKAASTIANLDVIQRRYPDDYAKIAAILGDPANRGATPSQLRAQVAVPYTQLIVRQSQFADRENVRAAILRAREGERAAVRSVEACRHDANPKIEARDPESLGVPPAQLRRDHETERRTLEQTATAPDYPRDVDAAKPLLQQMVRRVVMRLPGVQRQSVVAILGSDGAPANDADAMAVCRFHLALFDELTRMPAEQAFRVYKLMAQSAAAHFARSA